jgi:hypothetical protein
MLYFLQEGGLSQPTGQRLFWIVLCLSVLVIAYIVYVKVILKEIAEPIDNTPIDSTKNELLSEGKATKQSSRSGCPTLRRRYISQSYN